MATSDPKMNEITTASQELAAQQSQCNASNLRILLPADIGNIIYSRYRRPSLF